MAIAVHSIGVHLAENTIDNLARAEELGVTREFIERKVGFEQLRRRGSEETVVSMCCAAAEDLLAKSPIDLGQIDFVSVCTHHPDMYIPHMSARVHGALKLSKDCATYDVGLACSGYVYSLVMAKSFMEAQGLKHGLVFTSDPYSDAVDQTTRNEDIFASDAATVTYLAEDGVFDIGRGTFHTFGEMGDALIHTHDDYLRMDGFGIYTFALRNVPPNIEECLKANGLEQEDVDCFVLHQANKYIVDCLQKRMKLRPEACPFLANRHGNTSSSTIPIELCRFFESNENNLMLTGFGAGLSIASVPLRRK
ncbi:Beta-ketoacyl-acyl-carrier-protein synthase III [Pseudodesulfovibrio mercurii]|uniref:Beta-ketoacyl-acyl-carrier-protein synthase III n=1 Tax=Pseudodesulfovibrio mercurii TaxID=641491 RepID=F0JDW8_9BACT|nr:ketoacyl-ACP synthase III [Pseudodesulfovibrio mercurii]EGB13408.1 Beta-ketoacyl-acyl-carrier-protein synthase III [Pseudodesulfovibrio mercurii]